MQRPAVNWVADVCLSPQDKFVIHHPAPCLSHSARPSVRLVGMERACKEAANLLPPHPRLSPAAGELCIKA